MMANRLRCEVIHAIKVIASLMVPNDKPDETEENVGKVRSYAIDPLRVINSALKKE